MAILRHMGMILLAFIAISTGGCEMDALEMGWNMKSGDISRVEKDWTEADVKEKIGNPRRIVNGKGVYTGWTEWVYKEGSVYFYRMDVQAVVMRDDEKSRTYNSMFETNTTADDLAKEAERFSAF